MDLEAMETHVRSSMHRIGAKLLEELIASEGTGYAGATIDCGGTHRYRYVEDRTKELLTVLGPIQFNRAYYYDKQCKQGKHPKDEALKIAGSFVSSGVHRMMARVGAFFPFAQGEDLLEELAGLSVDAKSIERWSEDLGSEVEAYHRSEFSDQQLAPIASIKDIPIMYVNADGTGVPVVRKETINRKGKAEDGISRTREVKLGCIFTQTKLDQKGRPVRDENSTSYTGAIERADEFACRLESEAVRREMKRAQKICFIGDGAPWIWKIAEERFPEATQIIDLYHAREHYWNVANEAFAKNAQKKAAWTLAQKGNLDNGRPDKVAAGIYKLIPKGKEDGHPFFREAKYFEKNAHRMKYNEFRQKGYFVGSGVLEAGCKSVIGQRLKQSGMHWTVDGANGIIALRTCFLSNRWEGFWEWKHAA